MTVYTNILLEDYFVDEDGISDFVDSLGNDVIIAGEVDIEPEPPPDTSTFFGYLRLAFWQ